MCGTNTTLTRSELVLSFNAKSETCVDCKTRRANFNYFSVFYHFSLESSACLFFYDAFRPYFSGKLDKSTRKLTTENIPAIFIEFIVLISFCWVLFELYYSILA